MEIYVHIPFCVKKCRYCDFLSFPCGQCGAAAVDAGSAPVDKSAGGVDTMKTVRTYVDRLTGEIVTAGKRMEKSEDGKRSVESVFFGGGTPSILPAEDIRRILDAIRENFFLEADAEITIEANPGTITEEKLAVWKAAGVNRLSIGLQSSHDDELRLLGRIHTWQEFLDGMAMARKAGFANINVDLMSALPGQTAQTWTDTLRRVISLNPEHISAYSLIVEPGTPFYETYGAQSSDIAEYGEYSDVPEDHLRRYEGLARIPGETEDRAMYHETKRLLAEAGYGRYEISNYAKKGLECRHNLGYWTGTEYLGVGLGASSYLRNEIGGYVRFSVTRSLEEYLGFSEDDFARGSQYRDSESLTREDRMAEFMFLGLRLTRGVSAEEFRRRFGEEISTVYGDVIRKLRKEGLLAEDDGQIRLTDLGLDVSNAAMAEFLPE